MHSLNLKALFVSSLLFACLGGIASGHVTANPNQATTGSYFRTALRVSHGYEGSATVAVRVKIPNGVVSVKPQMKPGWEITITTRKLDQPIDAGHGQMVTETVDEVIWRGGPLPDAYFDEFGLSMKVIAEPGHTLYFPTVQECEQGELRWIEIPDAGQAWGGLPHPAPFLTVARRSHHH